MEAILIIAAILGVVFICREVTCWYFKFSEMVGLLGDIRDSLHRLESGNSLGDIRDSLHRLESGISSDLSGISCDLSDISRDLSGFSIGRQKWPRKTRIGRNSR